MTSTTIRQPSTTGASLPTRPIRLVAFGKLVGLIMAIGAVVAMVIAGGIGLAALLLSNATG